MTWVLWLWSVHWLCIVVGFVVGIVCLLVGMRVGTRVGFELASGARRRIADVAGPPEVDSEVAVPELFKPEEERKRAALRARYLERAGRLPWNYSRPGMTDAEREAMSYALETGKLDKAIDQVAKEELEKP